MGQGLESENSGFDRRIGSWGNWSAYAGGGGGLVSL